MISQEILGGMLDKHMAFLGANGSGKTSSAKGWIIEPALELGERVLNIDPTGVGWGLRLKRNGKPSGYEVAIFGGERGDYPLLPKDAALLAEAYGTSRGSAVFDTSLMTVSARTEWFTTFAETLLRKNKGKVKLVIDEMHLFAPQQGAKAGGGVPRMLHAANNLVSLGRSKGLRITMISQRPAKLHKDALSQAKTIVAMQVMAPQDRDAIEDWIRDQADPVKGKEIIASLPSLKPGEAWIWFPLGTFLERVKFDRPYTFDASAAPDDDDAAAPTLRPINLDLLKDKLATIAAEKKASDPVALRAENTRLQRELAAAIARPAPAAAPSKADIKAIEAAEKRAFALGAKASHEAWASIIGPMLIPLDDSMKVVRGLIRKAPLPTDFELVRGPAPTPAPAPIKPAPQPVYPGPRPLAGNGSAPPLPEEGERKLGPERRPLAVLARVHPSGMTEGQWRVASGLKRSGTWSTYVSRLRTAGLIERRGDQTFINDDGLLACGTEIEAMPAPGPELVAFWVSRIDAIGPMLNALAAHYPEWMTRDDLREHLNMKPGSGTFSTYLSRLRGPGLIEEDKNTLRAACSLMEGA